MLSKLAFKNAGKSFKDYAVYFFTLVMGVAIFYMFNSIYAQKKMMQVTETANSAMQSLQTSLSYISVFVAVILGFLIVYANRFFIKRRKKELGIYMTLGMSKRNISFILMLETSFLALGALVVGLALGVFGSQFMSVFTAKIFEADMSSYKFVFSMSAMLKSILYFGIIFLVVMVFNVITIGRCKLIDLIYGEKHNEEQIAPKSSVSIALFLGSVIILAAAYALILKNGLTDLNIIFCMSIILGVAGTFLFFFSVSGLIMTFVQRKKSLYYRGLNMFVLRQMGSSINTNFVSISIVSLVLFLLISIFSSGYSIQKIMSQEIKASSPYDYSLFLYTTEEEASPDIWGGLPENIKDAEGIKEKMIFNTYHNGMTLGDVVKEKKKNVSAHLEFISLSTYNAMRKSMGEEPVQLPKDRYIILAAENNKMKDILVKNHAEVTLDGTKMAPQYSKKYLVPSNNPYNMALVVPDDAMTGMKISSQTVNLTFEKAKKAAAFGKKLSPYWLKGIKDGGNLSFTHYISKAEMYEASVTTKAIVAFLAIYLGFVFMIICASILAIQQLSEAADNRHRYALLRKLGTEPKMIKKALFTQVFCYFLFPLLLAIVHSVVGLTVVNRVIASAGRMDATGSIIKTAFFVLVIYGVYFGLTYSGSKTMIKGFFVKWCW